MSEWSSCREEFVSILHSVNHLKKNMQLINLTIDQKFLKTRRHDSKPEHQTLISWPQQQQQLRVFDPTFSKLVFTSRPWRAELEQ